jgi:hypothetical protein
LVHYRSGMLHGNRFFSDKQQFQPTDYTYDPPICQVLRRFRKSGYRIIAEENFQFCTQKLSSSQICSPFCLLRILIISATARPKIPFTCTHMTIMFRYNELLTRIQLPDGASVWRLSWLQFSRICPICCWNAVIYTRLRKDRSVTKSGNSGPQLRIPLSLCQEQNNCGQKNDSVSRSDGGQPFSFLIQFAGRRLCESSREFRNGKALPCLKYLTAFRSNGTATPLS